MNRTELKYKQRVAFWYEKFTRISDETDQLQRQVQKLTEKIDKNGNEIFQVIQELNRIKQESEEMSFDNITLEK